MLISQLTNISSKKKLLKEVGHGLSFRRFQSTNQAEVIDGKKIADQIKDELKNRLALIPDQPVLNIIQIGDRPDSNAYIRMKQKMASEIGVKCHLHQLPEETTNRELEVLIEKLNDDDSTGVIVQLPVPDHIDSKIIEKVSPEKDVDGFHPLNIGALVAKSRPLFVPCTPKACIELLLRTGVEIRGKQAVVIGRSLIVGTPVFHLLNHQDATVTLCHSKTPNLEAHIRQADIVVVAIGKPNFVKADWIKPGAVVLDVGINQVDDITKPTGAKLVGDVDPEVANVAGYLSPVPGGVGPMTVMMLMSNVIEAAERNAERKPIKILPLNLISPVPKDYEVSKGQRPKNIEELALEIGVKKSECSLYGKTKAKVKLYLAKAFSKGSYK
jgi:methylenetetrahydrofolate dehydrogenase (NADP+)/methenyltetrahydrofolate cyclohydrolase/formyltetrahydrofolate synthetase